MATVQGVVERKAQNKYGWGILVDGKWYNSKYELKCDKDDTVEFEDGGKNYANRLKVVSSGGGGGTAKPSAGGRTYSRGKFPIEPDDGQISIIRQNALGAAINYMSAANMLAGKPADDLPTIIDVARSFEEYTSGELDREAAKRMEFNPED